MAGELPKVPYLAGEMVPTFVVPAKSAAINNSASAQKGSEMSDSKPVTFSGVVWAMILVLFVIPAFAAIMIVGLNAMTHGDPRFGGGLQFRGVVLIPPLTSTIEVPTGFNQRSGRQCDQARSAAEIPQGAFNVLWDESICAYHYSMR